MVKEKEERESWVSWFSKSERKKRERKLVLKGQKYLYVFDLIFLFNLVLILIFLTSIIYFNYLIKLVKYLF